MRDSYINGNISYAVLIKREAKIAAVISEKNSLL
jgi:hypothetical protein